MLSQYERNAIDAFLSQRGVNMAAMLRAEIRGYNLDTLRLEIINKISESSQSHWTGLPVIFSKKPPDTGSGMMR